MLTPTAEISLSEPTRDLSASQTLSCFEMWMDGIKAVKHTFDPLSDAVACLTGILCCVATAAAQADENQRPATRHDVIYAEQERQNDARELECAFATGACIGDVMIDGAAILLGSLIAAPRAAGLTLFGNNQRSNDVFGIKRADIDDVDLGSSCRPITTCC